MSVPICLCMRVHVCVVTGERKRERGTRMAEGTKIHGDDQNSNNNETENEIKMFETKQNRTEEEREREQSCQRSKPNIVSTLYSSTPAQHEIKYTHFH